MNERYALRVYSPARKALEHRLPLSVALAVSEFCDGPLRNEPRRLGRPLGRDLIGYFSARRGAYRVIYRADDEVRVVHVVRIDHRADVYRRR